MVLDLVAIDTETTGVGWYDEAFMISMATDAYSIVYDRRIMSIGEWDDAIAEVFKALANADKIIMHNAKFDMQKLIRLGINGRVFYDKFEDTQAMAHLIDEHQSTSLKHLARVYLNETTDEDEVLKVYRRKAKLKKEDGYEPIPYDILAPYAKKDAEFTLRLYEYLINRLPKESYPLYEMEKEMTLALLRIEAQGMHVDREYITQKRREYGDKIYWTKAKIAELSGPDFNPQSPQQVLAALEERGVSVSKTDKATLASVDDELATLIVDLREANKIKTTYFDAMYDESKHGVLHPNFRQHGTRTGRMSSGSAEA
jgi:DNA polymerase I-like protein with 3'-5' exonuclease and polymerase domains